MVTKGASALKVQDDSKFVILMFKLIVLVYKKCLLGSPCRIITVARG